MATKVINLTEYKIWFVTPNFEIRNKEIISPSFENIMLVPYLITTAVGLYPIPGVTFVVPDWYPVDTERFDVVNLGELLFDSCGRKLGRYQIATRIKH
jgi:hypothetical protein